MYLTNQANVIVSFFQHAGCNFSYMLLLLSSVPSKM